jgi:hypothetical protein
MLDATETSKTVFGGAGVDRCEGGDRTPTASFSGVAATGGDSKGPGSDGTSGARSSSVGVMHNNVNRDKRGEPIVHNLEYQLECSHPLNKLRFKLVWARRLATYRSCVRSSYIPLQHLQSPDGSHRPCSSSGGTAMIPL